MVRTFRYLPLAFVALFCHLPLWAQDRSVGRISASPQAIDDEALETLLTTRLSRDAAAGRCLTSDQIAAQSKRRKAKVALPPAPSAKLSPAEVHERGLASVLMIAGVARAPGSLRVRWNAEISATAWVAADGGIAVTNWHIFDDSEGIAFGAANSRGEVFPLAEILACDPDLDVAWVRFSNPDGSPPSLPPLPLAVDEPVGSWLGLVSHPGGRHYTLSQGFVSRYSQESYKSKSLRWLETSAEFAVGSSGGPALNDRGAVIGMATMTESIAAEGKPRDYPQQMVIKSCVPSREIVSLIEPPETTGSPKE